MMTDQQSYWFADATGLSLEFLKTKIKGAGTVRIPLSDNTRLSCKLQVVASKYYGKDKHYVLLMHVRGDLYLMFGMFEGAEEGGTCLLIDGAKLSVKPEQVFSKYGHAYQAISAMHSAIVRRYKNKGMNLPWKAINADSMDEPGSATV